MYVKQNLLYFIVIFGEAIWRVQFIGMACLRKCSGHLQFIVIKLEHLYDEVWVGGFNNYQVNQLTNVSAIITITVYQTSLHYQ